MINGVEINFSVGKKLSYSEYKGLDNIFGTIVLVDSDTGEKEEIGSIMLSRIDIEKNEVYNCFDSDDELLSYFDLLEHIETLENNIFSASIYDLMIIRNITINKKFRKHGIALNAIIASVELFGRDNCLTVLRPTPLQFISGNEEFFKNDFEGIAKEDATKKLKQYYQQLYFQELQNTDYLIHHSDYCINMKNC